MDDSQKSILGMLFEELEKIADQVFNRNIKESSFVKKNLAGLEQRIAKIENLTALKPTTATPSSYSRPRFKLKTFTKGQAVMVRSADSDEWVLHLFDRLSQNSKYQYYCGGKYWHQCRKLNAIEMGI